MTRQKAIHYVGAYQLNNKLDPIRLQNLATMLDGSLNALADVLDWRRDEVIFHAQNSDTYLTEGQLAHLIDRLTELEA